MMLCGAVAQRSAYEATRVSADDTKLNFDYVLQGIRRPEGSTTEKSTLQTTINASASTFFQKNPMTHCTQLPQQRNADAAKCRT